VIIIPNTDPRFQGTVGHGAYQVRRSVAVMAMSEWVASTRDADVPCAGCGGTCGDSPDPPANESSLSSRSLVLGSVGFFIGPILLSVTAAALVDQGGLLQLAAGAGGLTVGMTVARFLVRAFGLSGEDSS
jgi:hypothetical protein